MSGQSGLNKDQNGVPYGQRRLSTDSDDLKENTPVVALSDDDGNDISPEHPLSISAVNVEETKGTRTSFQVSDDDSISLLADVLHELKIMNMHLQIMTGEKITNQEVR